MVRVMFFFWSGKIFLSINCLHGNEGFLLRTRSDTIHWQNVNSLLYCLSMDDARIPRGSANPGGALTYYYRPQRSCGQGNIFTPVCHSVHRGVPGLGGGIPQGTEADPPDQAHTPLDQTHHPPDQTHHPPPRTRHTTPQTRHPPTRHPPDQTHHPLPLDQTHTPQTRHPLGSRLRHTVYEWPVHILLECILVWHSFC